MNDERPDPADQPDPPTETARGRALKHGKKAMEAADKAATFAEQTSGVFSAIKWVAIAIILLILLSGGWAIYKAVSVPAKAVGSAMDGVSGAVKAGGEKVMEGSSDVLNRLVIAVADQRIFDAKSEAAFKSLTTMEPVAAETLRDRVARSKDFSGHEDRVCKFDLRRDGSVLPVTIAADNKAYATAKALGSKNERLIRMTLTAADTDVDMRVEWDGELEAWGLKWKSTTLKKPVEDPVAAARALDVLTQAAMDCR